jgi:hypothetical protein
MSKITWGKRKEKLNVRPNRIVVFLRPVPFISAKRPKGFYFSLEKMPSFVQNLGNRFNGIDPYAWD